MKRNYAMPLTEVKTTSIRASLLAGSQPGPGVPGTPSVDDGKNAQSGNPQLANSRESID